jgi:hypothetical protein
MPVQLARKALMARTGSRMVGVGSSSCKKGAIQAQVRVKGPKR